MNLHPFVVYAIVGVWVGTSLAWLACKLLPGLSPAARARLWAVPLLAPPVLYGLWLARRYWLSCLSSSPPAAGPVAGLLDWLCAAGTAVGRLLTPVLVLALIVGVAKAVASLWLARRLVFAGETAGTQEPRVRRALESLAWGGRGRPPKVAIVPRTGGPAFTVGLVRPVVVLSQRLVDQLDNEELEAVLAHEMAHIIRGDHRKKWLSVLLRDVLLFTGLSGVAFSRLQAQVELLADSDAATATGRPLTLASAIVKSLRLRSQPGGWSLRVLDSFLPALTGSDAAERVGRLVAGPSAGIERSRAGVWVALWLWTMVTSIALLVC